MSREEHIRMDWNKAKDHFDAVERTYLNLRGVSGVSVDFALRYTFEPIAKRYNGGERTKELYKEMLGVE